MGIRSRLNVKLTLLLHLCK